jgi:GT2 family glycosyltransferase
MLARWLVADRSGLPVLLRELRLLGPWRGLIRSAERAAFDLRESDSRYRRFLARRASRESAANFGSGRCDVLIMDQGPHLRACLEGLESQARWLGQVWLAEADDSGSPSGLVLAPRVHAGEPFGSEHVLLLGSDVVVRGDALADFLALAKRSGAVVAFADEDAVDAERRCRPLFKPDCIKDLAGQEGFPGRCCLVHRDRVDVAELRTMGLDAYLTRLVVGAGAEAVVHLPRVAYSVRHQPRADRRENPTVAAAPRGGEPRRSQPGVTSPLRVVIPSRDNAGYLCRCVESLAADLTRGRLEVLIVDNGSRLPETRTALESLVDRFPGVRIEHDDRPFNWSALCNHGAGHSGGEHLLFLNDDTEALPGGWLDPLTGDLADADVGTVGGLLLFPDGTIQHAGLVVGLGGFADHLYAHLPLDVADGYHPFPGPLLRRNVLASTGACLGMRRDVFERLGGFDERLAVCGDLDFCVRAHESGLRNIYEPAVRFLHHEAVSRGSTVVPVVDLALMRQRLEPYLEGGDPCYNANLDLAFRYPCLR